MPAGHGSARDAVFVSPGQLTWGPLRHRRLPGPQLQLITPGTCKYRAGKIYVRMATFSYSYQYRAMKCLLQDVESTPTVGGDSDRVCGRPDPPGRMINTPRAASPEAPRLWCLWPPSLSHHEVMSWLRAAPVIAPANIGSLVVGTHGCASRSKRSSGGSSALRASSSEGPSSIEVATQPIRRPRRVTMPRETS